MLLSIKLGAAINMPTKRMEQLLEETTTGIAQAKNRAVTRWYVEHYSKDLPEKLEWGKENYHVCREVARQVNSNVMSSCANEVMNWLKSRVPYNHKGKAKYRWQAVLLNEISLPTFRDKSFPIPAANYRLVWEGKANRPDVSQEVLHKSRATAVLRFPCLSNEVKADGVAVTSPICRLLVGDLSSGHKTIIRRLLDPNDSLVMCDSRLSLDEKNGWMLRLSYKETAEQEVVSKLGPDDKVVTLLPNDHRDRSPLLLILPDGRKWYTGFGPQFIAERTRVLARRSVLQRRYKDAGQGGHGRNRYYAKQRPVTRGWDNFVDRIEKQVIADVVKACRISGAVGVVYREPTMPLRRWDWYGRKGMPWAWSEFALKLKAKLTWEQLCYEEKNPGRIGCKEYRDFHRLSDMPSADEGESEATA